MAKRPPRLTQNEIDAICEALSAKLAGFIEEEEQPREVYESAHDKMSDRLHDKKDPTP